MKRKNGEATAACWVLTDETLRCWWVGPGFRPVTGPAPPATWPTLDEARQAADALNDVLLAMGLRAVPQPVRAP